MRHRLPDSTETIPGRVGVDRRFGWGIKTVAAVAIIGCIPSLSPVIDTAAENDRRRQAIMACAGSLPKTASGAASSAPMMSELPTACQAFKNQFDSFINVNVPDDTIQTYYYPQTAAEFLSHFRPKN